MISVSHRTKRQTITQIIHTWYAGAYEVARQYGGRTRRIPPESRAEEWCNGNERK